MGRKRKDEKHTPVLNRHLLEGAFAESMSQVLMSLDQCRDFKNSSMTLEAHVRALWGVTMDETSVPLMLVEGRHSDTLVKKQALWKVRVETLRKNLFRLDPNDMDNLSQILKEITVWIQDAHLILHEDTPHYIRLEVSEKMRKEGDDEEATKQVVGIQ